MKIYEIGTGYTSIPAQRGAATEIVVEELTKSLTELGKNVSIVDVRDPNRRMCGLPIIEVAIPLIFTQTDTHLGILHKIKRVIYSISLSITLREIINESSEKIVIHFHNQYNMFFFLLLTPIKLRRKCLLTYTNHSYIWHGKWGDIKRITRRRYFQEIKCMKQADVVYVLNENTQKNLIECIHIKNNKVHLIDNGVNTDIYHPLAADVIENLKTEMGFAGKKLFIQVGSVCERKNQLGAIQLLLPLLKKNKNLVFAYAGGIISDNYQNEIMNFSASNNIVSQVHYFGEVEPGETLNKYYNIAEAMVFPSKSEGFSLTIIEAMAAGIPVIINSELKFRLAGSCLRYTDESEFVQLITKDILDREHRSKISEKIRELAVKKFSWRKIALDYLETWETTTNR